MIMLVIITLLLIMNAILSFGQLTCGRVHRDGEHRIRGEEFMRRAREASRGMATQEAFEYYLKHPELIKASPDDLVVFPDALFHHGEEEAVRGLTFIGTRVVESFAYPNGHFNFFYRVAVILG